LPIFLTQGLELDSLPITEEFHAAIKTSPSGKLPSLLDGIPTELLKCNDSFVPVLCIILLDWQNCGVAFSERNEAFQDYCSI